MRQRAARRALLAVVAGAALTLALTSAPAAALLGRPLPGAPWSAGADADGAAGVHRERQPATDPLPSAPARVPGVTPPLEQPFLVAAGVTRRTVAYGPAGLQQTVDVYRARDSRRPAPTVLLLHGGAWQIGDSTEWAGEAVQLVRSQGWTVVAVNYRLAPRSRWPAAHDDVAAAVRLVAARADELGVDPQRMAALGDSAGAHLAGLLGEPGPDRPALRAVVTWSGVNDLAGLVQQVRSGGCSGATCRRTGLALRVTRDLMGCLPTGCPSAYRQASPAARVTARHAPTLALHSEAEQIDARQSWVMDSALGRAGVTSRVVVQAGAVHGRGYQRVAWPVSLRFLAAHLTPEATAPLLTPQVRTTLALPARSSARVGRAVRLTGTVQPRQSGSSVALQVRSPDGSWRTARTSPLVHGARGTAYAVSWTPRTPGTVVWRATWRGGGAEHSTLPRTVVVR